MLTDRDLATIRAALAFWRDEMAPHGADAMRPYFDRGPDTAMAATDIERLRRRFAPRAVRYARFVDTQRLVLVPRSRSVQSQTAGDEVVTLLGGRD